MTLALLWSATNPAPGQLFFGAWHYLAHLAAFGVLAAVWTLALPRARVIVLVGVIAFAFAHEAIEVRGHMHAYELADALVDAAGAIAGAAAIALGRALFRTRA